MTLEIRSCRRQIGDLRGSLGSDDLIKQASGCGLKDGVSPRLQKVHIEPRDKAKPAAFVEIETAEFGTADMNRLFQHGHKYWFKLSWELEITCSTSEVAVCRSKDCFNSLSNRAFSMAITP